MVRTHDSRTGLNPRIDFHLANFSLNSSSRVDIFLTWHQREEWHHSNFRRKCPFERSQRAISRQIVELGNFASFWRTEERNDLERLECLRIWKILRDNNCRLWPMLPMYSRRHWTLYERSIRKPISIDWVPCLPTKKCLLTPVSIDNRKKNSLNSLTLEFGTSNEPSGEILSIEIHQTWQTIAIASDKRRDLFLTKMCAYLPFNQRKATTAVATWVRPGLTLIPPHPKMTMVTLIPTPVSKATRICLGEIFR